MGEGKKKQQLGMHMREERGEWYSFRHFFLIFFFFFHKSYCRFFVRFIEKTFPRYNM